MTTTKHDLILADPRPDLAALDVLLEGDPTRSPWVTIGPGRRPRHIRISRDGRGSRSHVELPVEGDGTPSSWRVGARDLLDVVRGAADWRAIAKAREQGRISVELGDDGLRVAGVALFGEPGLPERPIEPTGLHSVAGSSLAVGIEIVSGLGYPIVIDRATGEDPIAASVGPRSIVVARGLDCSDAVREGVGVSAVGARALALGVVEMVTRERGLSARCVGGLEIEANATDLPEITQRVVRGLAPSESAEPIPRSELATSLRATKVKRDGLVRVRHGGEVLSGDVEGETGGVLVRADDLAATLKALSGAPRVSVCAHRTSERETWLELSREIGPGAIVVAAIAGFV